MTMAQTEQPLHNDTFDFDEESLEKLASEVKNEVQPDIVDYADFLDDALPEIDFDLGVYPQSKTVEPKPLTKAQLELVETDIDFSSAGSEQLAGEPAQEAGESTENEEVNKEGEVGSEAVNEATEGDNEPVPAKAKMKIKEIKYGMTVITNIGNYENIRTHIEATAEIESNEDFLASVEELSSQIRTIGRSEYREIKKKNGHYPLNQPNRQNQIQQPYQNQQQLPINPPETQANNQQMVQNPTESSSPADCETE